MCRVNHLPQPEVNVWIDPGDDDPAMVRADFVWREHRLVVETDGHRTHRPTWRSSTTAAGISG